MNTTQATVSAAAIAQSVSTSGPSTLVGKFLPGTIVYSKDIQAYFMLLDASDDDVKTRDLPREYAAVRLCHSDGRFPTDVGYAHILHSELAKLGGRWVASNARYDGSGTNPLTPLTPGVYDHLAKSEGLEVLMANGLAVGNDKELRIVESFGYDLDMIDELAFYGWDTSKFNNDYPVAIARIVRVRQYAFGLVQRSYKAYRPLKDLLTRFPLALQPMPEDDEEEDNDSHDKD